MSFYPIAYSCIVIALSNHNELNITSDVYTYRKKETLLCSFELYMNANLFLPQGELLFPVPILFSFLRELFVQSFGSGG